jgi:phosphoglucomutase
MPPLIEYLIKVKKMEGGIVKSISTTNNIKRVADYYLRNVYVAPVGFKYLADMMAIRKTFIGVESTDGASLNQTIQIKDGILFNLLVTEMLAHFQLKMDKILHDFYLRFPRLFDREISIKKTPKREKRLQLLLEGKDTLHKEIPHKKLVLIDGIKFVMGESWLLIRESGRENVIRIYAESPSMKETRELIRKGRSLIG